MKIALNTSYMVGVPNFNVDNESINTFRAHVMILI